MVKAPNRGPFTLDGTRTFLVGEDQVAVIDPGPDVESHIRALSFALGSAAEVRILLTHRHGDHAGAAHAVAQLTGGSVLGPTSDDSTEDPNLSVQVLEEGDQVPTDHGELRVIAVPGHTRDHLAFHWMEADALFVGDLLLGKGNTTWLGEYLGSVRDYLVSLERVEALGVSTLYPAHGPPITSPAARVGFFRRHRLERLEEVRAARNEYPLASAEELASIIYGGEIPEKLRGAARSSVEAAIYHLDHSR